MGKVFLFIFFPKFVASFTLFQPINMQTKTLYLLILLILFLCCPTLLMADEWDENLYKQIEASISLPTIGQSEVTVSRFGASETASNVPYSAPSTTAPNEEVARWWCLQGRGYEQEL